MVAAQEAMTTTQCLTAALLEKFGNVQGKLAKALGVSQPTISRWLTEEVEITQKNFQKLLRLARECEIVHNQVNEPDSVPIVGYVGAGGEVLFGEGQGPFGEASMPPNGNKNKNIVAVQVRGDSMAGQLEDGWLVYYEDRRDPPTEDLYQKLCVVGLTDGRVLIKWLEPGRTPGTYDLRSTGRSVLIGQHVAWAARVTWIQPS